MRKPDLLLLLAVLAGIAALAHAPEWLAAPRVALDQLAAHEGAAVAVEALAVRSYPAGAGAQVVLLGDGTAQVAAFWGKPAPLEGAWLAAAGTVERVEGQWQLRLFRVDVLAPPDAPLHADQAARLAPALKGREVAVLGELAWPEQGRPELRGSGARLPLAPAVLAEAAGLVGTRALARGVVAYDASTAAYLLEAWEVRAA